jgi:hypothetical protein
MDEHGVGASFAGAGEQLLARRDAGDDLADLRLPLDLKAVRTVIAPTAGVEELVEIGDESLAVDGGAHERRVYQGNTRAVLSV